MNPFTESTVARPLSKNHPDRRWPRPQSSSHVDIVSDEQNMEVRAPHDVSDRPVSTAVARVVQGDKSAESKGKCRARTSGRAGRRALALGVCLTISSLTGIACKPMVLAGGVAIAGVLVPSQARAIDLNSATPLELQSLNGIGPKTAQMIVDERSRGGAFASLSELSDRVRGIGPKKAAALQAAGLKVGPGSGVTDVKAKPPQGRKRGK